MAWVITALYMPSIIYLGYREGQVWRGCWEWGVGVLIGFVFYLVLVFIKMQFDMRWESADLVKILMRHWMRLNSGGDLPRQDEWVIIDEEKDYLPHFVQEELNNLRKKDRNCRDWCEALMKICLWWRFSLRKQDRNCGERCKTLTKICLWWRRRLYVDDRWKTELSSYLLIIIATAFAIFLAVLN